MQEVVGNGAARPPLRIFRKRKRRKSRDSLHKICGEDPVVANADAEERPFYDDMDGVSVVPEEDPEGVTREDFPQQACQIQLRRMATSHLPVSTTRCSRNAIPRSRRRKRRKELQLRRRLCSYSCDGRESKKLVTGSAMKIRRPHSGYGAPSALATFLPPHALFLKRLFATYFRGRSLLCHLFAFWLALLLLPLFWFADAKIPDSAVEQLRDSLPNGNYMAQMFENCDKILFSTPGRPDGCQIDTYSAEYAFEVFDLKRKFANETTFKMDTCDAYLRVQRNMASAKASCEVATTANLDYWPLECMMLEAELDRLYRNRTLEQNVVCNILTQGRRDALTASASQLNVVNCNELAHVYITKYHPFLYRKDVEQRDGQWSQHCRARLCETQKFFYTRIRPRGVQVWNVTSTTTTTTPGAGGATPAAGAAAAAAAAASSGSGNTSNSTLLRSLAGSDGLTSAEKKGKNGRNVEPASRRLLEDSSNAIRGGEVDGEPRNKEEHFFMTADGEHRVLSKAEVRKLFEVDDSGNNIGSLKDHTNLIQLDEEPSRGASTNVKNQRQDSSNAGDASPLVHSDAGSRGKVGRCGEEVGEEINQSPTCSAGVHDDRFRYGSDNRIEQYRELVSISDVLLAELDAGKRERLKAEAAERARRKTVQWRAENARLSTDFTPIVHLARNRRQRRRKNTSRAASRRKLGGGMKRMKGAAAASIRPSPSSESRPGHSRVAAHEETNVEIGGGRGIDEDVDLHMVFNPRKLQQELILSTSGAWDNPGTAPGSRTEGKFSSPSRSPGAMKHQADADNVHDLVVGSRTTNGPRPKLQVRDGKTAALLGMQELAPAEKRDSYAFSGDDPFISEGEFYHADGDTQRRQLLETSTTDRDTENKEPLDTPPRVKIREPLEKNSRGEHVSDISSRSTRASTGVSTIISISRDRHSASTENSDTSLAAPRLLQSNAIDPTIEPYTFWPPTFYLDGCDRLSYMPFDQYQCSSYLENIAFCDCLIPELQNPVHQADDNCYADYERYFMFGRRGLAEAQLSEACEASLRVFLEKIRYLPQCRVANLPNENEMPFLSLPTEMAATKGLEDADVVGNPQFDQLLQLANQLRKDHPSCPWKKDSGEANIMECMDHFRCHVNFDGWGCCTTGYRAAIAQPWHYVEAWHQDSSLCCPHNETLDAFGNIVTLFERPIPSTRPAGNRRCPPEVPVMCDELASGGSGDFICRGECARKRSCSPILHPEPVLLMETNDTQSTVDMELQGNGCCVYDDMITIAIETTSKISCLFLCEIDTDCLGATVSAGPGPIPCRHHLLDEVRTMKLNGFRLGCQPSLSPGNTEQSDRECWLRKIILTASPEEEIAQPTVFMDLLLGFCIVLAIAGAAGVALYLRMVRLERIRIIRERRRQKTDPTMYDLEYAGKKVTAGKILENMNDEVEVPESSSDEDDGKTNRARPGQTSPTKQGKKELHGSGASPTMKRRAKTPSEKMAALDQFGKVVRAGQKLNFKEDFDRVDKRATIDASDNVGGLPVRLASDVLKGKQDATIGRAKETLKASDWRVKDDSRKLNKLKKRARKAGLKLDRYLALRQLQASQGLRDPRTIRALELNEDGEYVMGPARRAWLESSDGARYLMTNTGGFVKVGDDAEGTYPQYERLLEQMRASPGGTLQIDAVAAQQLDEALEGTLGDETLGDSTFGGTSGEFLSAEDAKNLLSGGLTATDILGDASIDDELALEARRHAAIDKFKVMPHAKGQQLMDQISPKRRERRWPLGTDLSTQPFEFNTQSLEATDPRRGLKSYSVEPRSPQGERIRYQKEYEREAAEEDYYDPVEKYPSLVIAVDLFKGHGGSLGLKFEEPNTTKVIGFHDPVQKRWGWRVNDEIVAVLTSRRAGDKAWFPIVDFDDLYKRFTTIKETWNEFTENKRIYFGVYRPHIPKGEKYPPLPRKLHMITARYLDDRGSDFDDSSEDEYFQLTEVQGKKKPKPLPRADWLRYCAFKYAIEKENLAQAEYDRREQRRLDIEAGEGKYFTDPANVSDYREVVTVVDEYGREMQHTIPRGIDVHLEQKRKEDRAKEADKRKKLKHRVKIKDQILPGETAADYRVWPDGNESKRDKWEYFTEWPGEGTAHLMMSADYDPGAHSLDIYKSFHGTDAP
ncbi:unnamed protein product [Amoebophrya sp. A25]|nr:unnamed protein product [Amoebophrya sp. A25]|eukprot:GSA25T00000822001.1